MKNILLLIAFMTVTSIMGADCTNAYASASYSLSHAKRSLDSNNFDHQQYYAGRALDAFEKTRKLVEACGCDGSLDAILDGIEDLNNALDPKDWDMGRYYSKKAVADAQNLLSALDACSRGDYVPEALPGDDAVATAEDMGTAVEKLKDPEEFDAQLQLKRISEITQVEFIQKWRELAELTGCYTLPSLLNDMEKRSESALNSESLENTRSYYKEQFIRIQKRALEVFMECSANREQEE